MGCGESVSDCTDWSVLHLYDWLPFHADESERQRIGAKLSCGPQGLLGSQ